MTRIDAIKAVADDKRRRNPDVRYSHAMNHAEEIVSALEVLGVVKLDDPEKITVTEAAS